MRRKRTEPEPPPLPGVSTSFSFSVEASHDHGDWRYVEFKSGKALERMQLHLSPEWFEAIRHVGTPVTVSITIDAEKVPDDLRSILEAEQEREG